MYNCRQAVARSDELASCHIVIICNLIDFILQLTDFLSYGNLTEIFSVQFTVVW